MRVTVAAPMSYRYILPISGATELHLPTSCLLQRQSARTRIRLVLQGGIREQSRKVTYIHNAARILRHLADPNRRRKFQYAGQMGIPGSLYSRVQPHEVTQVRRGCSEFCF